MKVYVYIPARYASTRLPGKPLVDICGKTMIEHVYDRAKEAKHVEDVIIATDDDLIMEAVKAFGGKAVMTGEHTSGTDRIAEAAKIEGGPDTDIIVNLQGDEPLIDPRAIEDVAGLLLEDETCNMATLATEIKTNEELNDPNIVKVVLDKDMHALYFSRSPIPHARDKKHEFTALKHLGIYAYRRDFLYEFSTLNETVLERTEKLEQLRVLENGFKIKVAVADILCEAVDTEEDLKRVKKMMQERKK